ncbi:DUF899 family protein [Ornithinimicrobium murale]|uniref:DUF899 family protein n=1 Tax=Ornithinimicrobium murale TaxID=1050153 RepID=UPI000E0D20AD|nr:DUF899 family protein [Ornithinimicrobium murale]
MRLPTGAVETRTHPPIVDRATWEAAVADLLVREKAHTREGDAIAAARRRLPMTEVPRGATIVGPRGAVPFVDAFAGRSMLVAYFHMWHDGHAWEGQCEGCTFSTAQIQLPEYLNARDVTLAIFSEGSYEESAPYAEFMGYRLPWWSARDSAGVLLGDRGFGVLACYLRVGDRVFETWWTTDRGTEVMDWSYGLLDRTVYGRQEAWESSPEGWPTLHDEHAWRVAGRPTAQWRVTDEPAGGGHGCG